MKIGEKQNHGSLDGIICWKNKWVKLFCFKSVANSDISSSAYSRKFPDWLDYYLSVASRNYLPVL